MSGARWKMKVLGAVIVAGALSLVGSPAFAAPGGGALTCTGGEITSGEYSNVTVTGDCAVAEDAVIAVSGNLVVRPGASLTGDGGPSTITVGNNVTAGKGSTLTLGCQPPWVVQNTAHPCGDDPENNGIAEVHVGGNISVSGAAHFALNGVNVGGNLAVSGGGSGGSYDYWSIKNNKIEGNVSVAGSTVTWMGVMFNGIGGNTSITNVTITDDHPGATPAVFVVRNTIQRNLVCTGNTGVVGGFDPTALNGVGGHAVGQCAAVSGPLMH